MGRLAGIAPPLRERRIGRVAWHGLGLGMTLVLAGCGGGSDSGPVFKPLAYSYLTPLRLNVGELRIEDQVPPPDPADLGPGAPVPPEQALKQMAHDRLVAAGNSGTAVFTIDQAAITGQPGGTLDGTMAVHLDIVTNSGGHAGYAEAHVSREFVPGVGTDNAGLKSQLYTLTTQMMADMNVELEFQLRRTLGDWMLDASGAPVATSVQEQPLASPGTVPAAVPDAATDSQPPASVGAPTQLAPAGPMPLAPGAPMQLAPPDLVATPASVAPPAPDAGAPGPTGSDAAPDAAPQSLSPPPGMLQAPPGAVPVPVPVLAAPVSSAPVSGAPIPLAPVPLAPVATAPTVSAPSAPPYHGRYPTPPGYAPSGAAPSGTAPSGTAPDAAPATATPGGY